LGGIKTKINKEKHMRIPKKRPKTVLKKEKTLLTYVGKPFFDVERTDIDVLPGNSLQIVLTDVDFIDVLRKIEGLGSVCLSLFNTIKKYYMLSEYTSYRTGIEPDCDYFLLTVRKTSIDYTWANIEAEVSDPSGKSFIKFIVKYRIYTTDRFQTRFKEIKEKTAKTRFNAFKQPLYFDIMKKCSNITSDVCLPDLDKKYYAGHFRNFPIVNSSIVTFMAMNTAFNHIDLMHDLCFVSADLKMVDYISYKDRHRMSLTIHDSQDLLEIQIKSKYLEIIAGTITFKKMNFNFNTLKK